MWIRIPALVSLCLLSACTSEAPPNQPSSSKQPRSAAELALEADARSIEGEIAGLRAQQFQQPVAVRVSDEKGLLAYIDERRRIDTTPERDAFLEESARISGLIPAKLKLVEAITGFYSAQVGGFYDPPTKSFRIMQGFEGDLARVIMAHEFVHALDDQLHDLDKLAKSMGNDSDATFAFSALCEGSAMSTMTRWMLANAAKLNPAALAKIQEKGMAGMKDLPPMVWKPSLAAYTAGQAFVEAGGSARLAEAFARPPRSSEQILHPEKYWSTDKRDDPVRVEFKTDKLPAGWKVLGQDTLGEIGLMLLTMPKDQRKGIDPGDLGAMIGMKFTSKPAEGWDGDRMMLSEGDGARVLDLVVVFDTDTDAEEFRAAMQELVSLGTAVETGVSHTSKVVHLRWSDSGRGLAQFTPEYSILQ